MKRNYTRPLLVIAAILVAFLIVDVKAQQELTVTEGFSYDKDGRRRSSPTASVRYDVAGDGVLENIQFLPTNELGVLLTLGGVTDPGFATFKNIGPIVGVSTNPVSTNSIQIGTAYATNGVTNFVAFLLLDTNQTSHGWLATDAPRGRATGTNSVRLSYTITDR